MNVKKYLIPILFVCLMAGQIAVTYADDYIPHLEVTTANSILAAGSKGNIAINFYNGGNYDVTEIDALLTSTTPGVSILSGSQKVINKIERGKSGGYEATVMVDQSVAVGAYSLTMTLSYLRAGRGIVTVSIPVSVVVDQPSLPMVKITASSSKITPGVVNQLHLTAQNMANTSISDVEISFSSSTSLITIVDPINFRVSQLGPGESATFDVSVNVLENTPIGAYAVTARIWYKNGMGTTSSQTISIPLEVTEAAVVRSPVVTVRNLAPRTVLPGEEFSLLLEASCMGAPVYNAKAVLSVGGLVSPMTQTTVSLGDIPSGGDAKFSYTLLIGGSASAGEIPLTVSVKYVDAKGVQGVVTETITIPVENLVKFSLMGDAVVIAEKGKTTTLEADLLLVGTGKVEFSSISVVADGPVEKVTGSTEYIGAVDPDSPVPFTLLFKVRDNATVGSYDLNLKISYLDSRNVEQNRTISAPLQVVNPVVSTSTTTNDGGVWGWLRRLFGLQ